MDASRGDADRRPPRDDAEVEDVRLQSGSGPSLSRTNRNLWSAFIGQARARRLYAAYASKAVQEGYPDVAQVFLEVASAPAAYPVNTLTAVDELHSTQENLRSVVEGELYETETMYPRMIEEAETDGRSEAVDTLRVSWHREQRHLERFRDLLMSKGWDEKVTGPTVETAPPANGTFVDTQMEEATRKVHSAKERVASLARIREVIFGMQDGLISTAILVSSVYGATGDNFVTIIAGLAGGLGGVVSMAAGSFLSSRAEREVKEAEIQREARHFHENPAGEVAEMIFILRREGLSEEAAVLVSETLAQNEDVLLRTMIEKELGLSPEVDMVPWKDAIVMGVSFLVGAILPIFPYLFLEGRIVVVVSLVATALGLFAMGAGKTRFTGNNPLTSGLEVLGIGLLAAVLGYVLGAIVPGFFSA